MKTLLFITKLTPYQALLKACKFAKNTGEQVCTEIDDIMMIIDKGTSVQKAVADYRNKLEFKYEIERLRKQR